MENFKYVKLVDLAWPEGW